MYQKNNYLPYFPSLAHYYSLLISLVKRRTVISFDNQPNKEKNAYTDLNSWRNKKKMFKKSCSMHFLLFYMEM